VGRGLESISRHEVEVLLVELPGYRLALQERIIA
jgi:hypothetical protein